MAPPWSQFGAIWVQDGPSRDPLGAPSQRQSPPKSLPLAQKLTRWPPRSPRMPPSTSFWTLFGHLGSHSEGLGVPLGVTSGEGRSRLGPNPSAGNFEDPLAITTPAVPPRTTFFPGHRAELAIATCIIESGPLCRTGENLTLHFTSCIHFSAFPLLHFSCCNNFLPVGEVFLRFSL